MDNYELRAAMAAARAEANEPIDQIDVDLMPKVALIEARGYPAGDYQPPTPKPPAPTMAEIEALVDRRIAAALSELWPEIAKGTAMSITRTITELRAEIQEQVGLLRADLTIEKAAESREHDRSEVIELPNPLTRSRRA